jgi:hypothetical protein
MRIFQMTSRAKPETLIARQAMATAPAAHSGGGSHYVQLLPLMIFCFGMLLAAIPMMLA